jgi:hypothetical protein
MILGEPEKKPGQEWKPPYKNPFVKGRENLDEQARLLREEPEMYAKLKAAAPGIYAEEQRKLRTRTLNEFNQMDANQKIAFINQGGEVIA